MPVSVRLAMQDDFALVEEIENSADSLLIELLTPDVWERAMAGSKRATSPGFVLVSSERVAGDPVGFVHVVEGNDFAHLEQLSVLPHHGRRGHGRALVEAAKLEAKRRGGHRMTLRTFADVPWNAPFYGTCGFVESEPATEFHRRLVQAELDTGLPLYGQRVEMTAYL